MSSQKLVLACMFKHGLLLSGCSHDATHIGSTDKIMQASVGCAA